MVNPKAAKAAPSSKVLGKRYGYVRVSTVAQSIDRQKDALLEKGIEDGLIFSDKISGTKQSRPGLDEILRHISPGDSITVHSMDRLGRSALHVMQTIAALEERGVSVLSLKEGEAQYTGATGQFMRGIMILVADWERSMNAERVAEARAARSKRAKTGEQIAGRPRTALAPAKVKAIHAMRRDGMRIQEIATQAMISRASVYRALAVDEISK
jgi:DNA invertase Pin-like site-specific DNA recombinase